MSSIVDFGAVADGVTNNAASIQAAIDAVAAAGGGRVTVPAGAFRSGSLQLKPRVELHLSAGAQLIASGDYADYSSNHDVSVITGGLVAEVVLPRRAFIVGYQAHGATITGTGRISGSADEFIETVGKYIHTMRAPAGGQSQYLERPFTLFLIDCSDVVLRDFTLTDPAFWAIRLTGCDGALIQGIRILTDLKVPNADGIDIDRCENVRILGCELITADDCISLKTCTGTPQYGGIKNVVISDCIMTSTSGAITLGTEACSDIERVVISNCVVSDSHRGIAIRPREGGQVRDVLVSDCFVHTKTFSSSWWGHGEPLHVTAAAWDSESEPNPGNPERKLAGSVRNIRFSNIDCKAEAGVLVWGERPQLISGVAFDRVRIEMRAESSWEPRIDLRPAGEATFLEGSHSAFELMNAADVRLRECQVVWHEPTRDRYLHAVFAREISDLQVVDLRGSAARSDLPAVSS